MFKNLFSKEGRKERSLKKALVKANDHRIKPDDRRPAIQVLVEDGSRDAIEGLLGRFTFNYQNNMVSDEEEKSWVFDTLKSFDGQLVLPALKSHMRTAKSLSWALRLLRELFDQDTIWELFAATLADHDPGYERDPTRKQQLINFALELDDTRVGEAVVDFLEDHDETVRYTTVEALEKHGSEELAREPLLKLLSNPDEESRRIKNRVCKALVERSWTTKGMKGTLEKLLNEAELDYISDSKGRIKPRRK